MEKIKTFLQKNMVKLIILLIIILVGIYAIKKYNNKETVDTRYIIAKLEKSSELTTAKLKYTGVTFFKDKGISFINKSDFAMVYDATARAGIDVKNIKVEIKETLKTIIISIPKAEILDVKIDVNTIKYYDEKFALFNINEKQDANKAIAQAEKEAKKYYEELGVLEMADNQAETLVKGLINDLIPSNYKLVFKNV